MIEIPNWPPLTIEEMPIQEVIGRIETLNRNLDHLKSTGAYDHKKQGAKSPDGLTLEPLKQYFIARALIGADGIALVKLVQERRNAIHAFKDRPIGDETEFFGAVRGYLCILRDLNDRMPYPDDIYVPRET